MSVFSEEDNSTLKLLGIGAVGFAGLTVFLAVLAVFVA